MCKLSSGLAGLGCLAVGPGGVLVVVGAVFEAAVEDADEAVAEGSEGLMVEVAFLASLVVEASTSFALADRAEGPLVDSVSETPVADVSGVDGPSDARSSGYRRRAGIVFCET